VTPEEHKALYELFMNPPPGSKIAAAKEYGVDLTLLLHNLTLTPTERVQAMESALRLAEEFRRAGERARSE